MSSLAQNRPPLNAFNYCWWFMLKPCYESLFDPLQTQHLGFTCSFSANTDVAKSKLPSFWHVGFLTFDGSRYFFRSCNCAARHPGFAQEYAGGRSAVQAGLDFRCSSGCSIDLLGGDPSPIYFESLRKRLRTFLVSCQIDFSHVTAFLSPKGTEVQSVCHASGDHVVDKVESILEKPSICADVYFIDLHSMTQQGDPECLRHEHLHCIHALRVFDMTQSQDEESKKRPAADGLALGDLPFGEPTLKPKINIFCG